MKRIALLGGCLLAGLSAGAQVTLDECRRLAREHYPEIRQYDLVRRTEEYTLSNARRAWLPQLSFAAQATWQTEVPSFPNALAGMLAQQGIDMPGMNKDQYKAALELNQTTNAPHGPRPPNRRARRTWTSMRCKDVWTTSSSASCSSTSGSRRPS